MKVSVRKNKTIGLSVSDRSSTISPCMDGNAKSGAGSPTSSGFNSLDVMTGMTSSVLRAYLCIAF